MIIESFYVKESQLDLQQKNVLQKKLAQHLVVTGGAGSGKSILALLKAKAMLSNNDRVLYVVKTVALNTYMNAGVSAEAQKERTQPTVGNSDDRIWGRLKSSICSFNHCFKWVINENGEWENLGWKKGHFDYIILDEATDLKMPEIQVLKNHCQFFVAFGDDDQQLFSFIDTRTEVSQIANEVGLTGEDIDNLIYNHRLPKKMARLVVYFHPRFKPNTPDADNFIRRCLVEGTELPHVFQYSRENEQFDEIIKIVKNKNGGLKSVGILFRDNESMKRAYRYFTENDLPTSMVIDSQTTGEDFDSAAPNLMTYHGAKGLQFETVFIPNCSDPGYDKAPLYVALTRTYSSLYIMYTGQKPYIISQIPSELYEANNEGPQRKFNFGNKKTSSSTNFPF
ncbi:MAG: AAA family ATPase [Prevotella sp.]|nr:AAA family ATPase [Prevotella sp.]